MCEKTEPNTQLSTCLFINKGALWGYTAEDDEREMKKPADCSFSKVTTIGRTTFGVKIDQCYSINSLK
jgi:hypothetical protein